MPVPAEARHPYRTRTLLSTIGIAIALSACGGSESSVLALDDSSSDVAPTSTAAVAHEPVEPRLPVPYESSRGSEHRRKLDAITGRPAPELGVEYWLNATDVTWTGLRGRVVLLDFWGAWCAPCKALTPTLRGLQRKYESRGFTIVGIHTARDADRGRLYVRQQQIEYPIGFERRGNPVAAAYHVNGYPDLHLVDHRGVLRYADLSNGAPVEEIESAIEALLAERERDLGRAADAPERP